MSATWWHLLDHVKLSPGDKIDLSSLLALAAYNTLDFVLTVHSAGTGVAPTLAVQHAATAFLDALVAFPEPIAQDLTATAVTWVHIEAFTRFVGWFVSGEITNSPVVSLDVIART